VNDDPPEGGIDLDEVDTILQAARSSSAVGYTFRDNNIGLWVPGLSIRDMNAMKRGAELLGKVNAQ
jgi:hypothetical protein